MRKIIGLGVIGLLVACENNNMNGVYREFYPNLEETWYEDMDQFNKLSVSAEKSRNGHSHGHN